MDLLCSRRPTASPTDQRCAGVLQGV